MGNRGRNALVAAIAALCALVTMGIIDLGANRRAQAAAPAQGWRPRDGAALASPGRQAVGPAGSVSPAGAAAPAPERARGG